MLVFAAAVLAEKLIKTYGFGSVIMPQFAFFIGRSNAINHTKPDFFHAWSMSKHDIAKTASNSTQLNGAGLSKT